MVFLFSLCRLRNTTQLRSGTVDKSKWPVFLQNASGNHSAMPQSHHLKSENSKKTLINFFSHSQLQCKVCGFINDYYVTLRIHSHAEVTIVIWYLRLPVSCGCNVLRQWCATLQHCRAKCTWPDMPERGCMTGTLPSWFLKGGQRGHRFPYITVS